ncbi:glycogen phosphorylase [Methylomarinovum tepidoasis]|uniref:Alpha-1,4 glucan phosphorylase n=1 Tax=Methylomarinovum tepidoasis TaxID=2840183 RepID=A0AAU9BYG8_9GAMM|nr:glycogen/starch/alpha-glucan phosphorylase [Methylomarinovum sp. IN45]BCX88573.1 glycogen phosphorylase [Methylomarinovum sp. IN45]
MARAKENLRTGLSRKELNKAFEDHLIYTLGRLPEVATPFDYYQAAAYVTRDRMMDRWIHSARTAKHQQARTVCYLSAEFLLGPHLGNNLLNLGILDQVRESAADQNVDFEAILAEEVEPGLGNGGLGRLAACYMDSLATLRIPAIGYGIRYEFGMFEQVIRDGWQVEKSDNWLRNGNPWELQRPKLRFPVRFGGHTESYQDDQGRYRVRWVPEEVVVGVAYDTPILGYGGKHANMLRLWKAEACETFDFQAFNVGDYYQAVEAQMAAENLTKVLYPNDEPEVGKELRLRQQYFFVSCALQDMLRIHTLISGDLTDFHAKFTVQLNDTHPAIAVAELMRLLLDDHGMGWEQAWDITRRTFAYTNHTLLPEALETWPVELFERLLPRLLEIIYEINRRFLDEVRIHFIDDPERVRRLSLIDEDGGRRIRMANLACVGSYAINGVARLHTELLKSTVLKDFHDLWPEKFSNKTNGVSPRRFLALSNPALAGLLDEAVEGDWRYDLDRLRQLEALADDAAFQERWQAAQDAAKAGLARLIARRVGVTVDPASLFDVQVKRIHEYKRQHLNVLHVLTLYHRLKHDPGLDLVPRTFIFGGKAAPGYHMAKLIIKLINAVAEVVNHDPDVAGRLKVVFFPNFNVSSAQHIYPAADLSEQISTAGMEASGTGNMKFMLNGALTIGTLDGANVEIREEAGPDNFFLFGLTVEQLGQLRAAGYRPWECWRDDPELGAVLDLIDSGLFSHGDRELFKPITDSLRHCDPFFLMADYRTYVDTQNEVSHAFGDRRHWRRMSILNTARVGKFSSDRAIREYCEDIWKVSPLEGQR